MIRQLNSVVNQLLNTVGYEIRRKPSGLSIRDPFEQQRQFFQNRFPVIIFDVGAHVGKVTKKYRHTFPNAHIHAFEPFDKSYDELNNLATHDANLTVNQLALTDHIGTEILHINRSSATNSLLQTDKRGADFWERDLIETYDHVHVETITINSYCHQHKIDQIDILKLDIQGSELAALKGAETLLKRGSITLVYTEALIAPTYKNQTSFHDLISYLKKYGLELFNVYDMHYRQNQLIQLDAIFMLQDANLTDNTQNSPRGLLL